jgi:hypothetical protein
LTLAAVGTGRKAPGSATACGAGVGAVEPTVTDQSGEEDEPVAVSARSPAGTPGVVAVLRPPAVGSAAAGSGDGSAAGAAAAPDAGDTTPAAVMAPSVAVPVPVPVVDETGFTCHWALGWRSCTYR